MTSKVIEFKRKYSFEQRFNESQLIKIRYPDRIPIICNRYFNSNSYNTNKSKFIVPIRLTIGEFIIVIRKQLKMSYQQSIYFIINDFIPSNKELLYNLYNNYRDQDGFLYIFYTNENTFGGINY